MAQIQVTISEMNEAASKIAQAAQDFKTAASNVLNSANKLADSWEGDSQVAFQEEQNQANQWYQKMAGIVETYVTNLKNTAQTYQETDAGAASNIKSR